MTQHRWRSAFSIYTHPRVFSMLLIGFAAGLPFNLISSTLSAWQADIKIDSALIGYFSLVGAAYSIKALWSPLVDQVTLPILGRLGKRRSWMLLSQLGIVCGLLLMSHLDMHTQLLWMALLAIMVAVCSATQDIAIDAYRIEIIATEYQGAMASMYLLGYRLALLLAGAGVLYLADWLDWRLAYQLMAAAMALCVLVTLWIPEPERNANAQPATSNQTTQSRGLAWLHHAIIGPFADFFQRNGKRGLLILALIVVYKLSDMTMGVMANPFYIDLGFSKPEIAEVTKLYGFFMTIAGTSLGGVLVMRYGIWRPLLLGAVMVMTTNLLFATLAYVKPNLVLLAAVVSADNLSGGIAAAVFIAYLSSLTNTAYTATQYALFSSLMTLPAKIVGAGSGLIVKHFGYGAFFIYAGILGLPAIICVIWLMRVQTPTTAKSNA